MTFLSLSFDLKKKRDFSIVNFFIEGFIESKGLPKLFGLPTNLWVDTDPIGNFRVCFDFQVNMALVAVGKCPPHLDNLIKIDNLKKEDDRKHEDELES